MKLKTKIKVIDKIIFKIKLLRKRFQVIPGIEEKRKVIENYRLKYEPKTFIETGTFLGDTVNFFKESFEKIISIELSEELALKAKKRFEQNNNIQIIQGNSNLVLESIISKTDAPILFWLDGHYSSEFFCGDEFIKTAKGEKDTPINEELEIILKNEKKAIILIDDARLFNGENDYPTIKDIKRKVENRKVDYKLFVQKDIIHIIPV